MAINRIKVQATAEKLVGQGKLAQAIEQYKILLKDQPNDLGTLNRVGDLLAKEGKVAESAHLFARAAHIYTTGGFFLKAIAIYKKILKLDPNSSDARLRLADLYARGDFTSEARAEYVSVAETLVRQGFDAKAREVHEKLMRMEPTSVNARAMLADIYMARKDRTRAIAELRLAQAETARLGMREGALELLRRLIALDPPDVEGLLFCIQSAIRLGAADLAIATAEGARRRFPDEPSPAEALTEAFEIAGRPEDAEETAKTMVAETAENAVARAVLGRLHAQAGRIAKGTELMLGAARALVSQDRHREAANVLDTLLGYDPVLIEALELRIECASSLGADEEAAAFSSRLAAAAGKSVPELPSAPAPEGAASAGPPLSREDKDFLAEHLTEAEVFCKYGLHDKAARPLLEILERFPDHREAIQRLKMIAIDQGDRGRAIEQCLALADLHERAGEREDAIAVLMEARNLAPDAAAVRKRLETLGVPTPQPEAPQPEAPQPEAAPGAASEAGSAGAARSAPSDEEPKEDLIPTDYFDLGGELAETMAEVLLGAEIAAPAPAEEQSFDEVFRAFQERVDEVVDREDFKTHYELAIAYKEMGLIDEAIAEFAYASKDLSRTVDCCTLLGMCYREKGSPGNAEAWYRKALDSGLATPDQTLGLRYELGEAYREMGDQGRAREMFQKVRDVDRNYRSVSERLKEVENAVH